MSKNTDTHRDWLKPKPLTQQAFLPYGNLLSAQEHASVPINQGLATRHDTHANIDVSAHQGKVGISFFCTQPWPQPLRLTMLECHPLGSQAFFPITQVPYLVVVAPANLPSPQHGVEVFLAQPHQGVNYFRGTWHHPLLTLAPATFLVIDRLSTTDDASENCEVCSMPPVYIQNPQP